jgi:cupin 2 domain-containing protein
MLVPNLYQNIPALLPEELTEVIATGRGVRIERIVSRGHRSPDDFWFDQAEHEWVALLHGRARLTFADGGEDRELVPGEHLLIAAGRRHRVAWTDPSGPTVWLAVFFTP